MNGSSTSFKIGTSVIIPIMISARVFSVAKASSSFSPYPCLFPLILSTPPTTQKNIIMIIIAELTEKFSIISFSEFVNTSRLAISFISSPYIPFSPRFLSLYNYILKFIPLATAFSNSGMLFPSYSAKSHKYLSSPIQTLCLDIFVHPGSLRESDSF